MQIAVNEPTRSVVRQDLGVGLTWKQKAQRLQKEVHVFYFVFKHPRVSWYAKLVAACAAGYLFSPIQLIPSYIPVIGFLDDFAVLFLGVKVLQRIISPDVFRECRERADVAEIRRNEEIRSTPAIIASVVVAAAWLVGTVGIGMLLTKYISRW
jgi:uncharacterized membrane protein YkvA (DUF1232 family)